MRGRESSRSRDDRGVSSAERDGARLLPIREEPRFRLVELESHPSRYVVEGVQRAPDLGVRPPQDEVVDPSQMLRADAPDGAIHLQKDRVGEDRGRLRADGEAAHAAIVEPAEDGDGVRGPGPRSAAIVSGEIDP